MVGSDTIGVVEVIPEDKLGMIALVWLSSRGWIWSLRYQQLIICSHLNSKTISAISQAIKDHLNHLSVGHAPHRLHPTQSHIQSPSRYRQDIFEDSTDTLNVQSYSNLIRLLMLIPNSSAVPMLSILFLELGSRVHVSHSRATSTLHP